MKINKHKSKKMSEESLKAGNFQKLKKANIYYPEKSGIYLEIVMFFIFTFFLILSWLGLIKLYQYQYVFTIYRYINKSVSNYFPIQISSSFLIIMISFIILIISTTCIFFIIKLLLCILKMKTSKLFEKNPIIVTIPIIFNSLLFLLGIIINKNQEISYCYIGLFIDIFSLFVLLKINFDKKIKNNVFMINFDNECIQIIFENLLYDVLLALDLYYSYYVLFQIIFYLSNYDKEILNFSGIISNLSMGLVSLFTNLKLKSIGFNIIYLIIYLGIIVFQFTIRKEEREEFKVGYGEMILSFIFLINFFAEFIYIICFGENR